MDVIKKEDHLLATKRIVENKKEFTDEQAELALIGTEIKSEEDTKSLKKHLKKYRPKLYKKFKKKQATE